MITIYNYRQDRNERVPRAQPYGTLLSTITRSAGATLNTLAEYELGYGGYIAEISPTKLRVTTHVLSKIDNTIYEGSEEEMLPLLQFCYLFATLSSDEDVGKLFDDLEGTPLGEKLTIPLYVTTIGPLLIGHSRTTKAALANLIQCKEDIGLYGDLELKTLLRLIEQKIDEGLNDEQLREIARSHSTETTTTD